LLPPSESLEKLFVARIIIDFEYFSNIIVIHNYKSETPYQGAPVDIQATKGVTTSLEAPLNAGCNQLNAFLNQVNAKQNNGQLTPQRAAELTQQAKVVILVGCPDKLISYLNELMKSLIIRRNLLHLRPSSTYPLCGRVHCNTTTPKLTLVPFVAQGPTSYGMMGRSSLYYETT